MRGLETIRLVAPHTLPLNIIIHVAHTLDQRVSYIELKFCMLSGQLGHRHSNGDG